MAFDKDKDLREIESGKAVFKDKWFEGRSSGCKFEDNKEVLKYIGLAFKQLEKGDFVKAGKFKLPDFENEFKTLEKAETCLMVASDHFATALSDVGGEEADAKAVIKEGFMVVVKNALKSIVSALTKLKDAQELVHIAEEVNKEALELKDYLKEVKEQMIEYDNELETIFEIEELEKRGQLFSKFWEKGNQGRYVRSVAENDKIWLSKINTLNKKFMEVSMDDENNVERDFVDTIFDILEDCESLHEDCLSLYRKIANKVGEAKGGKVAGREEKQLFKISVTFSNTAENEEGEYTEYLEKLKKFDEDKSLALSKKASAFESFLKEFKEMDKNFFKFDRGFEYIRDKYEPSEEMMTTIKFYYDKCKLHWDVVIKTRGEIETLIEKITEDVKRLETFVRPDLDKEVPKHLYKLNKILKQAKLQIKLAKTFFDRETKKYKDLEAVKDAWRSYKNSEMDTLSWIPDIKNNEIDSAKLEILKLNADYVSYQEAYGEDTRKKPKELERLLALLNTALAIDLVEIGQALRKYEDAITSYAGPFAVSV